jgi:DNA-binding transcriptional MerR regulator
MAGCGTIDIMQELFFTSKQAAEISGCTLRQLQYWREKEIIVPTIGATGTGRSIYYSPKDVVELAVMEYCLRSGLNFDIATAALQLLKERSTDLIQTVSQPWLFSWSDREDRLEMIDFNEEKAIEWLRDRRVVIPLWLNKLPLMRSSPVVSRIASI